jgi:hypothetical protein
MKGIQRLGLRKSCFLVSAIGNEGEIRMASSIFEICRILDEARIHYFLERDRPDTITLTASFVGERVEIDVFDDDHVEISRFRGDESVEGGMDLLRDLIRREMEAG